MARSTSFVVIVTDRGNDDAQQFDSREEAATFLESLPAGAEPIVVRGQLVVARSGWTIEDAKPAVKRPRKPREAKPMNGESAKPVREPRGKQQSLTD